MLRGILDEENKRIIVNFWIYSARTADCRV